MINKKTVYIVVAFLAVAAIVAVLLHNRAMLAKGTAGVELTAFPVAVTMPKRTPLDAALSYTGTIMADNDVAIVAETSGRVTAICAKVGDKKPAGAILIEVDDELAAANCAAAEVAYEKAKRDLERNENLLKNNSISEAQLEAARLNCRAAEAQYVTARRALRNTKITTPISGTVTSCVVDTGAMVQRDKVVANVVDIASLKVRVQVPEEDVFKLSAGDTAAVTTDIYPGITFYGIIHTIGSKADEAHTYPVEITLDNDEANPLKANMFGKVTFTPHNRREAVVLPREALVGSVEKPQVFVVENGIAALRDITMGEINGLNVEILGGLTTTDTVVVNGQYNLSDSVVVTVVTPGGQS